MSSIHIRNLPPEIHEALKARAADHGRSMESEVREILKSAVRPSAEPIKLGSLLASIGRDAGLTDQDVEALHYRDKTPAEPLRFD